MQHDESRGSQPLTARVLWIDDLPDAGEKFADALREGHSRVRLDVVVACDRDSALSALRRGECHAVVAAATASGYDADGLLADLRGEHSNIPLLFTLDPEDACRVEDLMRKGARDCLPKHATSEILAALQREILPALADREDRLSRRYESIGRISAGIAHDFNNMLTAVNGHAARILRKLPGNDSLRREAAAIISAGERASNLARQLLVLSQPEVPLQEAVDLNQLVTELLPMLSTLLGENTRLLLNLIEDCPPVRADRAKMIQAVLNLAMNARDAMQLGGELEIATSVSAGRDRVFLSVRDVGEGMDASTLANAFEPFFTTKPAGRGNGLGLSLVKTVVAEAGGHVTVESAPGAGSLFRIFLPAYRKGPTATSH